MSDRIKRKKKLRQPSPVENTHDRRSRERAQKNDAFPDAPKAPDGVSGDWR